MIETIERPAPAEGIGLRRSQGYTPAVDARLVRWLAGQTSGAILEIGCNQGEMTCELALAFEGRPVIGVDWLPGGTDGGTMCLEQRHERPGEIGGVARGLGNVALMNSNSRGLDYGELERRFGWIGFVFIDGDHSYEGVKADTELALRYFASRAVSGEASGEATTPRGIVAWHDAYPEAPGWCGVWRYLDELAGKGIAVKRFAGSWVSYLEC